MGGTIAAIEAGWFQREIADSAYDFARRKASGEAPVIGVNKYVEPAAAAPDMPIHKVPPETEARQVARLRAVRARRDEREVARLMDRLAEAASDPAANLMEPTIAWSGPASMGEIVNRLRNIWAPTWRNRFSSRWGPRDGPPYPPHARGAPAKPWHPSMLRQATWARNAPQRSDRPGHPGRSSISCQPRCG